MKKLFYMLLVPALASCGFQMPEMDRNAWLAFNQDYKDLSYNKDRTPAQRFFDVDFVETADVHLDTDPATINNQNLQLMDLATQQAIPMTFSMHEYPDGMGGIRGKYIKLKASQVLKYNHAYRLIAHKGIKTRKGNAMTSEEIYDFQTEKEPLQLLVLNEGFDPESKTYQITLKNNSAFSSSGLIFNKVCDAPARRAYHAYVKEWAAGATATVILKLIEGSIQDNTAPTECRPLKAYDFFAEREILVNP
ncbi:hypothetical protein [Deinococcus cellulosilyticus]|uniref:Lipoprotein n=1 Tax=Deinococcus cellulosilyticus (strain DSM 18568 / NBRC 106333 / KACC 11606 / 5516J-15) TaxID=1223518 RepID=A0A511N6S6_DEIC1|nr:hypothetical protein [Deinococcus cellulosilyticus]GEM48545.1 hypothetical protein DC3_41800 [Deinococcus cellulosilyticus NBRC 106333 = KACC 11606]